MKPFSSDFGHQTEEGEQKILNTELWHACAGPLVSLPPVGSRVVYFPPGHSEQVAASTNKEIDTHTPNYPNLPPQLICQLHDVTMHADAETDEVYAQMTLQPLTPQEQKDMSLLPAELGTLNKQPTNYFCKILTASDTSTHGGFSVPRRAAEKVFPPLDYTLQPPVQELFARDLHDNEWKFRHIFRGQPKRHLLTTGWSVFVSAKRLVAGDSVIFIWNEKNQLLLGIRRACRPQAAMPSSVLSSDSMHIGLLAAAAHAASTNSRFTIFYNPRSCPSEFVVPLAKYIKAVYHTRVSVGIRFRMLFETEESSVRRYMGTITGISDVDPIRWPNSYWRSVKVGWDESTAGDRQPRVSLWEIEPLTTFPMYPSPFSLRLKRPWASCFPGMKDDDNGMNSPLMWLQREVGDHRSTPLNFHGYGLTPWMQPRLDSTMLGLHPDVLQMMSSSQLQDSRPDKCPNQSLLQFQHNQPAALVQTQLLAQSFQENQKVAPNQSHNFHSYNEQHHRFSENREFPKLISTRPQLAPTAIRAVSSTCSQQILSDAISTSTTSADISSMHSLLNSYSLDRGEFNLLDSNQLVSSTSCDTQSSMPQVGEPQTRMSELSSMLPPLPGRGIPAYQGIGDPQNNLLFEVNMQHNELSNLQSSGNESNSMSIPFACSTFPSDMGTDFPPGSDLTTTSCLDRSGFMHSSENVDHVDHSAGTFVKVHKSGSFGRSLDISRFSSYHELRGELAHLFGLEAELVEPLRSGWQLVFVDRENDILLLGDDPWQEFVNNVWYIKVLSPHEVHEMGKKGRNLSNSISSYNDYTQDMRNSSNGVAFS